MVLKFATEKNPAQIDVRRWMGGKTKGDWMDETSP
jgi:hypothetical protein